MIIFLQSSTDSSSGAVNPNPSSRYVFWAAEEGGYEVLFSHEFVGAFVVLTGEVAIGELVWVDALMSYAVRSIKNGERGA